MKYKLAAVLALSILALPMSAQQPQVSTQQQEFQKRYDALQAKSELLYNKLRDLSEFQQWVQTQKDMADFQKEVQTAAAKAQADAAKAAANPVTPQPQDTAGQRPSAQSAPAKK